METKNEIRKRALELRRQLLSEDIDKNSINICKQLLSTDWYRDARELLVYAAIQEEVNLSYFINQALDDKKCIYFPKVFGSEMEFYQVSSMDELSKGAFGVPEPPLENIRWKEKDFFSTIILVPGVAFDRNGMRIGYGKGYYDRFLKKHPQLYPIGIAHNVQIFTSWKFEECDIPMKEVIVNDYGRIM